MIMICNTVILHRAILIYFMMETLSGFFFSRIHFLHFMSYFFTASVGNYINYMTYVVMLIGYLTYILIDIPHFMYYLCLLVTGLWYKMQRDNQNILAT